MPEPGLNSGEPLTPRQHLVQAMRGLKAVEDRIGSAEAILALAKEPPQGGAVYVPPLSPSMRAARGLTLVNEAAKAGPVPDAVLEKSLWFGTEEGVAANEIIERPEDVPQGYGTLTGLIPSDMGIQSEHGGVCIVDPYTAIGAAHTACIPHEDGSFTLPWNDLMIVPRQHERHILKDAQQVREITVHSGYSGRANGFENDLVLFHFERPMKPEYVVPGLDTEPFAPRERIRFCGMGMAPDGLSGTCRAGDMEVVWSRPHMLACDDVDGEQFEVAYSGSFMARLGSSHYAATVSHYNPETTLRKFIPAEFSIPWYRGVKSVRERMQAVG